MLTWWRFLGAFATLALALLGVAEVPGQFAQWETLAREHGQDALALLLAVLQVAWFGVNLLAGIVAAYAGVCVIWLVAARLPWLRQLAKGVIGMEWLTRAEALALIGSSDFVSARRGGEARAWMALPALLHGGTRQDVLNRAFVNEVLKSFEEQIDGARQDDRFNADLLKSFLADLLSREVTEAMGSIPIVSKPKPGA